MSEFQVSRVKQFEFLMKHFKYVGFPRNEVKSDYPYVSLT